MDVLKRISLKNAIMNQYVNCVLVNNEYYFLIPSINKVYRCNLGLSDFLSLEIEGKYKSVTYNKNEEVFYVIKENDYNSIFITDLHFKEIGLVKLSVNEKYKDNINDIYYDDLKKRIYITTDNYIYSITEDGYFIKEEYEISNVGTITTTTMVRELDGRTYPITKTVPIPNTYFTCCYALHNSLYIGYVKENASYLVRISFSGELLENNYIDSDIKINSIINVTDCINLLILSNNLYNYIYVMNIKNNIQEYSECDWEQCHNKLLESVASVASSISRILNAESEKMKKVINESNDLEQVMEASNSVNKTIDNIASLEQIMLEKLECASKEK